MSSYARLAMVSRLLIAFTGRRRYFSVGHPRTHKTFRKILIANRGEIACRVMRTCKEMGIKTVAIYSDADAQALHVRMADESVRVGPAVAADSYLKMEAILDAIDNTESQAVHPGYGFFSENKEFAEELEKRGIVFIGPNTHAIHVMGDKLESKRTAMAAGVSTIPGFDGIVKDAEEAVVLASGIGYPVMLKASAGGGGKGMRIAWNDSEVRQGFQLATEEAKASVKDGRLLIEKFVDKSRHIEIQVLGDCHGNAIYLNERECSIQRRNQKVVEEAPSTFLDPETRRAMGEQAVALAKAVQYNSAGTCEFLVDSQKNFYFLEMNTRLQVEHPITELITGVDLVKEMIHSAAKYPLRWQQSDIGIDGWAVEARVYAEDPLRFLPSIGYLSTYREPTNNKGTVRVDTGIVEGSTISMYYDPMISKLVTHGRTREEALATMGKALDSYCIQGVKHNIPILRDIITQPKFVSGDITTNFIPEVYPSGFSGRNLSEDETFELLAAAVFMYLKRERMSKKFLNQDSQHRLDEHDVVQDLCVTLGEKTFEVKVPCSDMHTAGIHIEFGELEFLGGGTYTSTINRPRELELSSDWCLGQPIMFASIDGRDVVVQFEGRHGSRMDLRHYGSKYSVVVQELTTAVLEDHMLKRSSVDQINLLLAPMPGVVKAIDCSVDDTVEEGTPLITLEAMKMQNLLPAPKSGKIKEIFFKVGDSVGEDDVLMSFYP